MFCYFARKAKGRFTHTGQLGGVSMADARRRSDNLCGPALRSKPRTALDSVFQAFSRISMTLFASSSESTAA
jgi:hypothetical protein